MNRKERDKTMACSKMTTREFLKGTAWMGVVAAASGCTSGLRRGSGGTMAGFAMKPVPRIRVGIIGVGNRGIGAVHRLTMVPGVEVAAVCDNRPEVMPRARNWFDERKLGRPREFGGDEGWKALCDWDGVDVVYIATPWALHAPMALRALRGGKVALVEVPGAVTVDECWEIVETSESLRLPCMMLENCCYGEMELLGLNLVRKGLLGEIIHGEGGYIHDLRRICTEPPSRDNEAVWRYNEDMVHKGNRYPTHGLVPIMQAMDINRGDRFDYLVSLESKPANFHEFMQHVRIEGPQKATDFPQMGDMNVTMIKTALGRSVMVQHDVSSPRPYSRINLISGTKGVFWGLPHLKPDGSEAFKVAFEREFGDRGAHLFFDDAKAEEVRRVHAHPMWAQVGEISKKVGGHGGMDFVMDLRWAYCLQNGLPLDMDVYDLAAASCLCELTETSVRSRSRTMDVPDFTRGGWRTAKPLGIERFDMSKIRLDGIGVDNAALSV